MLIEQQLENSITQKEASTKIAGLLDPVVTDKEGNQTEKKSKKKPQGKADKEGQSAETKTALTVADAESAKGDKKPKKEVHQTSDDEQPEDAEDGETDDENADAETHDEEADPDDADAQGENDDGETEDDETLHTVVVDGKEVQIPYTELIAGYQRQEDYSRKMAEVSKQRKEVDKLSEQVKDLPQVRETYLKNSERFVQNGALVLTALEQRFMPKAPDLALAEKDPAAYIKQKELHQEGLQFKKAIESEIAKVEKENLENLGKSIAEGRTKLMELEPALKEPGNRQQLREYAHKLGFTDQQMAMEPNPVLFQLAYKAMRWDELQERKKQIAPTQQKPKVMKSTKAPDDGKAIREKVRAQRLDGHKQAGTVNSAAQALSGLIKTQKK